MTRSSSVLIVALGSFTLACEPAGDSVHQPTLAEVSSTADDAVDLLERDSLLADAVEDSAGTAPVLAGAGSGFFFDIDGQAMKAGLEQSGETDDVEADDEAPPPADSFLNVVAAARGVLWADVATALVLAPPAAAIAFAANGELTEHQPWLWSATNTVTGPEGGSVTADLNVAWVGVGWLAEMRLTSSDGKYDDTLWFNGFLGVESAVGWWDIYADGQVVGVVEWIADGQGNYQAGIAPLAGDAAGDLLLWLGTAEDEHAVSYYDASADYLNYAWVMPDDTGEVALINYNGGEPACWDENWADTDCEAAE